MAPKGPNLHIHQNQSSNSLGLHRILGIQISDCFENQLGPFLLQSDRWSASLCKSFSEAADMLDSEKFDLIVFSEEELKLEPVAESLLKRHLETLKICISHSSRASQFGDLQNQYGIQRFVCSDHQINGFSEAILQVLTRLRLKTGQRDLLRELDTKNRELERLTDGLEVNVQERTQSARNSKHEAELKQKRARNLIYFIKDLGKAESTEEIFLLLQKEIRTQVGINDLVMGLMGPEKKPELFYIQAHRIQRLTPKKVWPTFKSIQSHSQEMQKYLAEELGRPMVSVLYMPFLMSQAGSTGWPFLSLEHGYKHEDVHILIEFLAERLQAVAIAVDRVSMTQSLGESAMQWEKTFDAINEPVNIVDSSYKLLRSNRFFSSEISNGQCYKAFQSHNKPCFGCPMFEALRTGGSQMGEIRRGERIFRVNSYPIKIAGSPRATTVVNHYLDVTEDKKLYSRMIQSEKMAALGIMAGHIAHELNNPLTGLRSLSQVLQKEILNDERLRQDLSEIEKAAVRCQMIIKNLLEFSSLGEGFEEKPSSLNRLVEQTLPMIKTALRLHRSDIDLCETESSVMVNPHLLQQVIFNLVNNACQAMKEPGELKIRTQLVGDFMELSIGDTGPGIPENIRDRVFDPFFTTKPEGVGTGLGLSMSRSIIESFGGLLTLQSSSKEGSVFLVRLPIGEK
jgi:two-component system NtrC family sensor kinase